MAKKNIIEYNNGFEDGFHEASQLKDRFYEPLVSKFADMYADDCMLLQDEITDHDYDWCIRNCRPNMCMKTCVMKWLEVHLRLQ